MLVCDVLMLAVPPESGVGSLKQHDPDFEGVFYLRLCLSSLSWSAPPYRGACHSCLALQMYGAFSTPAVVAFAASNAINVTSLT